MRNRRDKGKRKILPFSLFAPFLSNLAVNSHLCFLFVLRTFGAPMINLFCIAYKAINIGQRYPIEVFVNRKKKDILNLLFEHLNNGRFLKSMIIIENNCLTLHRISEVNRIAFMLDP